MPTNIRLAQKRGSTDKLWAAVAEVLPLDVVDTMYLTAIGEGKWKKAAVAVVMGIILIVLGLLLYLSKWT